MALATTADLLDVLRQGPYLEPEQLDELTRQIAPRCPGVRELAKELVDRGWLTPWQINQLAKGKGEDLLLGQFLLLTPLGEGGMGQVFKARQRRLGRLSALKIVRKECLASPAAVQRFRREAQAAARLDHPNIVRVYDADEVKGTHLLAMEYIDGVDLSKLVKKDGPRPVVEACQFIRQAALGLQHAHERGMVHRDIKPSNLMCTKQGTIKILDMGLARLDQSSPETDAGPLTATGAVMGTPDYLAPEQARNARQVDIRADIYSLGCTLYYLLTGRPPFQSESLTEKLLQHQMDEPPAVEKVRPGLPAGLPAIIRKMMAKKPDDRFATPGAVAAALAPFTATNGQDGIVAYVPPPVGPTGTSDTGLADTAGESTQPFLKVDEAETARQAQKRRRRLMVLAGVAPVVFVILIAAMVWSSSSKPAAKTVVASRGTEPKAIPIHWPRAGDELQNSIKMKLVAIPPGKFTMGSDPKEPGHDDSEIPHEVEITRPFYMGRFEVTQEQYREVMKRNPSVYQPANPIANFFLRGQETDRFPVDNVSWAEAKEFCEALSALLEEKKKHRTYRLPTEAEWEYACRAGTQSPYNTGAELSREAANYRSKSISLPRAVGYAKKPNAFGLYDMHGNMQEWCLDAYGPYNLDARQDPTGPKTGTSHVLRGGCFESPAGICRSACRAATPERKDLRFCGFRVVLEVND